MSADGKNNEAPAFVLDSFGLLAYLQKEAGWQRVKDILASARDGQCIVSMSLISVGEVLYILERKRGQDEARQVLAILQLLPISLIEVSRQRVWAAAHIKARYSISYADAFAVALALEQTARVITGDPEFQQVAALVEVEWLPRK
jgi:ribonuclease VapC